MSPHVGCQTLSAQKDALHQAVLKTVRKHIEVAVGRYIAVQKNADNETDTINKTIIKINQEINTLDNAPFSLYDEYRAGSITKEQFIKKRETAKIRLDEAKTERQVVFALEHPFGHILLSWVRLNEMDQQGIEEIRTASSPL